MCLVSVVLRGRFNTLAFFRRANCICFVWLALGFRCDVSAMDEVNKSLALAFAVDLLPSVSVHLTDAKFTAVQASALKALEGVLALSGEWRACILFHQQFVMRNV